METVNTTDMVLRLLAASGAGLLLGWERESRGRPAGLRTTILTCVAAALAMIISDLLFIASSESIGPGNWRPDPARLAQGILTGIGFLGAGTILRFENFARGVTTAATLWLVTVLGLAFGHGLFLLGTMGTVLALVVLLALSRLEKRIQADWYSSLSVVSRLNQTSVDEVSQLLESLGVKVLSVNLHYDIEAGRKTVEFDLKLGRPDKLEIPGRVLTKIAALDGVLQVRWK